MELVQSIIENNGFPVATAFLLGIIVALHPCPLATNIAAMGYLAKDAHRRRRVFVNCLAYTFGRMLAYSLLGVVLLAVFRGSVGFEAAGRWFGQWGEKVLAPVLIVIGLYFILDRFLISFSTVSSTNTSIALMCRNADAAFTAVGAACCWACFWRCLSVRRAPLSISACSCRCPHSHRGAIFCRLYSPLPRRCRLSFSLGLWLTA